MTPRWSTASIRVRLTGWYAVVLSLMLVVYATATFVAVRHEFLEQLDEQLHDEFETAEGFLTATPDGRIVWAGDRHHDPDTDEDRGSDVWSASGGRAPRSITSRPRPDALPPSGCTSVCPCRISTTRLDGWPRSSTTPSRGSNRRSRSFAGSRPMRRTNSGRRSRSFAASVKA